MNQFVRHRPVRRVDREAGVEFSKYVSRFELKITLCVLKLVFYYNYNLGLMNKTTVLAMGEDLICQL